jgi:5-methylcytosine-specific restriction endonuclease McrA
MFRGYYYPIRHPRVSSSYGHGWVKFVVLLLGAMLIIVVLMPNQIDSRFHGRAYTFSREIQHPTPYRSIVDTQTARPSHQHQWQSYNQSYQSPAPIATPSIAPRVADTGKLYNRTRTRTKDRRKVSLALQKQVAASQGWKCAHCQKMLPSTFQTDHRIPLYTDQEGQHTEYLNSAANLDCLCNDCHAAKTQRESIIYKDLLQSLRTHGKR